LGVLQEEEEKRWIRKIWSRRRKREEMKWIWAIRLSGWSPEALSAQLSLLRRKSHTTCR